MTAPSFAHLLSMTDGIGIFEHADHAEPRREHGYCTDDVARLLIAVVPRASSPTDRRSSSPAPRSGSSPNRRARPVARGTGGPPEAGGTAGAGSRTAGGAASGRSAPPRAAPRRSGCASSRSYFDHGVKQRSPHRRAMAFAALGAAEVLDDRSAPPLGARALLADAVAMIDRPVAGAGLAVARAAVVVRQRGAAGGADRRGPSARPPGRARGRADLLRWLLDRETIDGHLSPAPVGGAGPDDLRPAFDQQPIEVAAIADACARGPRS